MRYIQSRNLLFSPDASGGGGAPAAAQPAAAPKAQPSAAPPASAPASTPPPAAPVAPIQSDDPFERPRKPSAAAPAKPGAPAAPVIDDPDKQYPTAPKELRAAYRELRDKSKTTEQKIAEYERKIESLGKSGQDTSALTTRLQQLERERDERDATIRGLRQEESPEFKAKYDEPYQQAAFRVQKAVEQLYVITQPADEANGIPAQTRPATMQDFTELYALPTGKAIERAKSLFGDASQWVIGKREMLLDLWDQRSDALQKERTQFKERNAKETADNAVRSKGIKDMYDQTIQRLTDTNSDYKIDPADTEEVEARQHALEVYDTPIQIKDEASGKQEIARRAHIRLKVAAFPVMKLRMERQAEKIASLEAQLAEVKGAAPGGNRRPGGDAPASNTEDDSIASWSQAAKLAVGAV